MGSHAAGQTGIFGNEALCGATPYTEPDKVMTLHSEPLEVDCVACRKLMLETTE